MKYYTCGEYFIMASFATCGSWGKQAEARAKGSNNKLAHKFKSKIQFFLPKQKKAIIAEHEEEKKVKGKDNL